MSSKVNWKISHEDIIVEGNEDIEYKLAHLLINDVIFCNNGWFFESWQVDHVSLHVNCNDVFAWGCADSEDIKYSEIPELYDMWLKDPLWGSTVWCIKKRKIMPQKPVESSKGWDLGFR